MNISQINAEQIVIINLLKKCIVKIITNYKRYT